MYLNYQDQHLPPCCKPAAVGEQSTRNPDVEGSNPATVARGEEKVLQPEQIISCINIQLCVLTNQY